MVLMKLVKWAQVPGSLHFTSHKSHSCHQLTNAGVSIFDPPSLYPAPSRNTNQRRSTLIGMRAWLFSEDARGRNRLRKQLEREPTPRRELACKNRVAPRCNPVLNHALDNALRGSSRTIRTKGTTRKSDWSLARGMQIRGNQALRIQPEARVSSAQCAIPPPARAYAFVSFQAQELSVGVISQQENRRFTSGEAVAM